MKRTYELMVVYKPEIEAKDTKKTDEIVKKLLGEAVYEITKTDVLGKKVLAYPIRKVNEGLYILYTLEAEQLAVGAIESKVKLEPAVLRYLLTVKDKVQN